MISYHGDQEALVYPYLCLAALERTLGDYFAAEGYAQQAFPLARLTHQPRLVRLVHTELGQADHARGDQATAQTHFATAYALPEKVDDAAGLAFNLSDLGQVALARMDLSEELGLF